MPNLYQHAECFFRNAPLKSMKDELLFPALLNCSKWTDTDGMGHPLSWICTQYLKNDPRQTSDDPELVYQGGAEAVRYCLLETSFNLSSEHHEGNSWYNHSKRLDNRITTIEEWEKYTEKDPTFVLDINWTTTGHTVEQYCERKFKQMGNPVGPPTTAADVARIILNS